MKTFNDPEAFARVKRLPPYVFTITDRLRDAAIARGVDVIDFSMGNPDGAAPEVAVEALRRAVTEQRHQRYLDPRGIRPLREAAAAWFQRRQGVELDPDREIMATIGSKDGIGHAMVALLQEGDAILAPTPTYPIHAFGAILAGGKTIPVSVGPGVDFMESLMTAAEKAEQRPRGLVVNFPANPSTAVATPELFQKIVRFAEARDLFILSDCAYCDIVFDGGKAPSMLQVPGARERTLEFVSMSKSYNMAGFRVGFAAGNHALLSALARVKSYLDYGLFGGSQVAAAVALSECDTFPTEVCAKYRRRRDALVRDFGAAGWPIPSPAASMFAWAPLPDQLKHLGSLEFARRLIEEAGVSVAPGIGFGSAGEGYVRIALVVDEQRIALAAARIAELLRKAAAEPARPSHTPVPRSVDRA
ncbi:MAG TPA: aminotransferase class I/II-fold pyridoxal phosphate-dependent enzyme [Anaeromyxobacteraceae bacterium]|nr:aminotransferase class I/II-fold pyridoxal phosphate-dependent enzyme [Anaeromyxobacteraceae bacterium]